MTARDRLIAAATALEKINTAQRLLEEANVLLREGVQVGIHPALENSAKAADAATAAATMLRNVIKRIPT